jgi:hypothetical protein
MKHIRENDVRTSQVLVIGEVLLDTLTAPLHQLVALGPLADALHAIAIPLTVALRLDDGTAALAALGRVVDVEEAELALSETCLAGDET